MKTARCRTCSAEIVWARMPSGKLSPFDAQASAAGGWGLTEAGGEVRARRLERTTEGGEPGYVSHFASCPQRDEHRRPRQTGGGQ